MSDWKYSKKPNCPPKIYELGQLHVAVVLFFKQLNIFNRNLYPKMVPITIWSCTTSKLLQGIWLLTILWFGHIAYVKYVISKCYFKPFYEGK